MGKKIETGIQSGLLTAAAIAGILGGIGTIGYDYAINRERKNRFGIRKFERDDISSGEFLRTDLAEETLAWAEKTPVEELDAYAYDGTPLHAYCFRQVRKSHRWLVAVHGYGETASSLFPVAKPFYEAGYNTLLPECRGYGKSGGDAFGLGWQDRFDVVKWINTIVSNDEDAEIVLFGLTTGADAVLMASGEVMPLNVRCIIADSAYSRLVDQSNYMMRRYAPVNGLLTFSMSFVTFFRAGYTFTDASAISQVAKSRTPILFIHGGKDRKIPSEMVYELYNSASCTKDLFVAPDAEHAYSMYTDYEAYWERVWKFVQRFCPEPENPKGYRERIKGQLSRIRNFGK